MTEDLQLYTRWSGTGSHTIGVSIIDKSTGNSIAESSDELDFGSDPVTYFTHDFSGTTFPSDGVYAIQVTLDGGNAAAYAFYVNADDQMPDTPAFVLSVPAESGSVDERGNADVTDIFEYFTFSSLPATDSFSIVTIWFSGEGQYDHRVQILDPSGKSLAESTPLGAFRAPRPDVRVHRRLHRRSPSLPRVSTPRWFSLGERRSFLSRSSSHRNRGEYPGLKEAFHETCMHGDRGRCRHRGRRCRRRGRPAGALTHRASRPRSVPPSRRCRHPRWERSPSATWPGWRRASPLPSSRSGYVQRARNASWHFPGAGQFMTGDPAGGSLFLAGDVTVIAGTLVGAYFLLPSNVQFSSLDYFSDPLSTIRTRWEGNSVVDYLPSCGVLVGGMIVKHILGHFAAVEAEKSARQNIADGTVTFTPNLEFLDGRRAGFGMRMRY